MGKSRLLLALAFLFLMGCSNQAIDENTSQQFDNEKQLVAKVGQQEITEAEFEEQMKIKKDAYENLGIPQTDDFYKTVSLGLLVERVLLEQEAESRGIIVSTEEVVAYLKKQLEEMEKLHDNDPGKIEYYNAIKLNGYNTPEDFINAPEVISAQKKVFARNLLKETIAPKEDWDEYAERLLNAEENYEIFIPVDIRGYRELERTVIEGYREMIRDK